LEVAPTNEDKINLHDNLRIIPHGLLGKFRLKEDPTGEFGAFPDDLEPVQHDLDFDEFVKNAREHDIYLPTDNVEELRYWCNVVRFGDIPAKQTKVSCLTIISEGAPEKANYKILLLFKFDCCRLVKIPIPLCRQVEFGVIYGSIAEED